MPGFFWTVLEWLLGDNLAARIQTERQHATKAKMIIRASVLVSLIGGIAAALYVSSNVYSNRIEDADSRVETLGRQLAESQATVERYRVQLKLSDPKAGGLVDLSNAELRPRAEKAIAAFRLFVERTALERANLRKRAEAGRWTHTRHTDELLPIVAKSFREYAPFRAELGLVNAALRSRLSLEDRKQSDAAFPDELSPMWATVEWFDDPVYALSLARETENMLARLPVK